MAAIETTERNRPERRYAPEAGGRIEIWKQGKPCFTAPGRVRPLPLDAEEVDFLTRPDWSDSMAPTPLTDRLEAMRVIRRRSEGEGPAGPVPIVRYPNYYVKCVDWTITDRCNYNCRHCFHATDNTVHRNEFSPEQASRFLDEVKACGIRALNLTGGEPTLYPWFREVLEGMRARGLALETLITNGSLLTEELLAFVKELHPSALIRLSFDGIGWHDWMRQHRGSEEKTLEAIRRCRAAGLRVHVNTNVHRKNQSVMLDSLKLLADLGIDRLRIIRTTEAPRWIINREDDTLTPEEYYDFSIRFAEQYRESGITVPVAIWQSLFLNGKNKSFRVLAAKGPSGRCPERAYICSALMTKPSVQADGEVVPCAPMGGNFALRGIRLGNVHREGLQALLTEGPFVDVITATVGEKLRKNPKCAACEHVNVCQGGCPAMSVICGGSVFSTDEYKCAFFNNGYYGRYRRALEGWTDLQAEQARA